jgi:hypothetical protein
MVPGSSWVVCLHRRGGSVIQVLCLTFGGDTACRDAVPEAHPNAVILSALSTSRCHHHSRPVHTKSCHPERVEGSACHLPCPPCNVPARCLAIGGIGACAHAKTSDTSMVSAQRQARSTRAGVPICHFDVDRALSLRRIATSSRRDLHGVRHTSGTKHTGWKTDPLRRWRQCTQVCGSGECGRGRAP